MNIRAFILLLAGFCLVSAGCQSVATKPNDSFHLTVQRVITDPNAVVFFLKIHVSHETSISVDGVGVHHMAALLPDSPGGAVKDGQVVLSASRILAHQNDEFAYIQTYFSAENPPHTFGGGASIHQVPAATTLETFFSVSATDGDYELDTPVKIAQLDGKPVMLVVGKPTKGER